MDTSVSEYSSQFAIYPNMMASWHKLLYSRPVSYAARKWPVPTGIFDTEAKREDWFWTDEWQEGERAAEKDIATGKYRQFKTADELISHLDGLEEK